MVRAAPQQERRYGGVYRAVAEAIEAELDNHRVGHVASVPIFGQWLTQMRDGCPLEVPAYLLPKWTRPRLEPGRPMQTALVSADDRVVLREETTADTVERLGL